jgi:hypothetical protein
LFGSQERCRDIQNNEGAIVAKVEFPQKARQIKSRIVDFANRDDFEFRNDDTVIPTFPKSGTTWIQNIVTQLVFNGAENIDRIADFLDIEIYKRRWPVILDHCGFEYRKKRQLGDESAAWPALGARGMA